MRCSSSLLAAAALTGIFAQVPELVERAAAKGGATNFLAIWTSVVPQLTAMFYDATTNTCTDDARAAIRVSIPNNYTMNIVLTDKHAAFHDCGTWVTTSGSTGGCDCSLVLANEATLRLENNGLQDISAKYLAL